MTRQIGQMQLARQDQMQTFMRGLQNEQERISPSNFKIDKFNLISESRKLKSFLRTLLLGPAGVENTPSHEGALISEEEMLNTHFNRILISSLVNGYAGLQDVPIDSILKHLMRYRHTSSILLEFLRNSRTHMAKALAQSLFKAAIEAGDSTALKTILRIPTIDVNKTLCVPRSGASYAIQAILYAADLCNLDLVRVLRKAGAIVDKSKPWRRDDATPFAELLSQYERSPDTKDGRALIHIAEELVLAGVEATFEDFESAIHKFHRCDNNGSSGSFRDDFIFFLASQCVQNSHSRLIRPAQTNRGRHDSLLNHVAEHVGDDHATKLTSDMIRICKQEHGGLCLKSYDEEVSQVLRTAARQGKLQLVQLLLPYSKQLHLAFTAAIGSPNDEIIDAVLAYGPDIDAPACLLGIDFGYKSEYITSFSEAVRCGNDRIIQLILAHGYMDRLEHGSRFHPAVTAAAQANDLGLLRSILDRHDNPHPAELGPALDKALEYGNEEAAKMLLESGASTSIWNPNTQDAFERALCNALERRDRDMTYALLDASHTAPEIIVKMYPKAGLNRYEDILREAAKWGDQGIITAIFTTFPWIVLEDKELAETLQNNDLATFNFLLTSQRVRPSALDQALEYAVRKEDEKMIGTLISLGANPFDGEVLEAAVDASLPTMNIVLSQKSTPRRPTAPGNGNEALKRAMERGAHGVEVIERLLQSDDIGLCTVSLLGNHSTERIFAPMGLGIQLCCRDGDDDMQVLKLFLKAGHSPDYIVQSECIIDEEFPEDLRSSFFFSSERYYLSNMTAVLLAIELRSTKLVKLLLDNGANVNLPARFRILRTPLQKACEVGGLEIVKLLLDRGADPNGEPARCQGATALQLAAISGNCRVAAELLDRGADLYQPPLKAGGHWPLVGAAKYGRLEMIEFLWKVSITGFDKRICDLAMKLAERWGHLACRDLIKDLMEHGPVSGIESMEDLLDLS